MSPVPILPLVTLVLDFILSFMEILPTLNMPEENKVEMVMRCKKILAAVVIPPKIPEEK